MDILDGFDSLLIQENKDRAKEREGRRKSLNPSSASWVGEGGKKAGKCKRAIYYALSDAPKDGLTVTSLWRMKMGNIIHQGLQDMYLKSHPNALAEVSIPDMNLGYSADYSLPLAMRMDLIDLDENNKRFGVEIKTTYGRGIKRVQTNKMPYDDALLQCILYLNYGGVDYVEIPYLARDTFYRTSFKLTKEPPDTYLIEYAEWEQPKRLEYNLGGIHEAWRIVTNALLAKEAPERDYNIEDKREGWRCEGCDYKTTCYGIRRAETTDTPDQTGSI